MGIDDLRVAADLSMLFLQRPGFADLILDTLREADIDASKLAKLRDVGARIDLDDFGAG